MPKRLEQRLRREAKRHHFGKARTARYIYGTLRSLGWTPKRRQPRKKRSKRT